MHIQIAQRGAQLGTYGASWARHPDWKPAFGAGNNRYITFGRPAVRKEFESWESSSADPYTRVASVFHSEQDYALDDERLWTPLFPAQRLYIDPTGDTAQWKAAIENFKEEDPLEGVQSVSNGAGEAWPIRLNWENARTTPKCLETERSMQGAVYVSYRALATRAAEAFWIAGMVRDPRGGSNPAWLLRARDESGETTSTRAAFEPSDYLRDVQPRFLPKGQEPYGEYVQLDEGERMTTVPDAVKLAMYRDRWLAPNRDGNPSSEKWYKMQSEVGYLGIARAFAKLWVEQWVWHHEKSHEKSREKRVGVASPEEFVKDLVDWGLARRVGATEHYPVVSRLKMGGAAMRPLRKGAACEPPLELLGEAIESYDERWHAGHAIVDTAMEMDEEIDYPRDTLKEMGTLLRWLCYLTEESETAEPKLDEPLDLATIDPTHLRWHAMPHLQSSSDARGITQYDGIAKHHKELLLQTITDICLYMPMWASLVLEPETYSTATQTDQVSARRLSKHPVQMRKNEIVWLDFGSRGHGPLGYARDVFHSAVLAYQMPARGLTEVEYPRLHIAYATGYPLLTEAPPGSREAAADWKAFYADHRQYLSSAIYLEAVKTAEADGLGIAQSLEDMARKAMEDEDGEEGDYGEDGEECMEEEDKEGLTYEEFNHTPIPEHESDDDDDDAWI